MEEKISRNLFLDSTRGGEKEREKGMEMEIPINGIGLGFLLFSFYCGWTEPLVQTPREVLFLSFNP